jgi:hypothetical protein
MEVAKEPLTLVCAAETNKTSVLVTYTLSCSDGEAGSLRSLRESFIVQKTGRQQVQALIKGRRIAMRSLQCPLLRPAFPYTSQAYTRKLGIQFSFGILTSIL